MVIIEILKSYNFMKVFFFVGIFREGSKMEIRTWCGGTDGSAGARFL